MNKLWAMDRGLVESLWNWNLTGRIDARLSDLMAAAKPMDTRQEAGGTLAVLPVYGIIEQHQSVFGQLFGGTSADRITAMGRQAMNDPSVRALVLDFSTPGGAVHGGHGLHAEIMSWREIKPVVGIVNSMACSLGTWLISACHEVVSNADGWCGSVGTVMVNKDTSKADEAAGVKVEYITAGEFKDQSAGAPLNDAGRASIQALVDDAYSRMISDIAAGRGVPISTVESDFGKGLVLTSGAAKSAGLVDRISSMDETLKRLSTPQGRSAIMRASAEVPEPNPAPADGEAEIRRRRMAV